MGAGAAGLMAAIFAAGAGREVVVIERTTDGGRKILISGGGRCNVLPSQLAPDHFETDSAPHLMRRLLRSWPLVQQRAFFESELGLPLALEEETGKLFPISNRARNVRDALVSRARELGAVFRFNTSVTGLEPVGDRWMLQTSHGTVDAACVILATGGLSVPTTGSDGGGLTLAAALGHRVHDVYPALTPLLANPSVHAGLSGVSLDVRLRARVGKRVVESSGGFLFTHRGYSGPAVLDLSHVAVRNPAAVIRVQWAALGEDDWEQILADAGGLVLTALATHVPQRLAAQLMTEVGVPAARRAADLRRLERVGLIARLTSYPLPWTGDEGFRKAEVTGGGVALEEIDSATLESRHHKRLFLCGEMLDAFGPIGGHNFAWAWATGRAAGLGAAEQ
ncbi:MAG: aminoacetone oxidase family FAD-binding enzyme [Planctomycetota bacterium]|nr:aminoacetone oxidase family FAD-binding enzyme [Planctomycetota bacterium]